MVIPKDRQIERRRRNAPSFERKGKCSYSATTVTTSTTDLGEVDEGEGKISLVRNIHGARRGEFFFSFAFDSQSRRRAEKRVGAGES